VLDLGGGVYALPGAPPDAVAAATVRGRLTCCSAAKRHGFDLLREPERPHVQVPRNRPRASDLAVVHRGAAPGRGPVVPPVTALLWVLRCLPALEAVVVVDSAVRQGKARVSGLRSRLRGPGSVEARRVLGLVDGSSGSLIETIMRLALRQAGLTVRCQVGIDGVGRVDMVIDGWLVIEVDGFAYHSERAQYRLDRARANALAVRGYVLLRFTYEDVMHRLPETVATVLAVHARGR
jgi:very-short-patch-repair endonuclease